MRMRSRIARVGMVAGGLLAMLGTTAQPAHATSVGVVAFSATATLTCPGLDYPLVNGKTPSAPTVVSDLPLNTGTPLDAIPNLHLNWGGNRCGVGGVGATLCATGDINVLKGTKPLTHVNAGCSFSLGAPLGANGNTVTGFCGLSGGQVALTFNDGLGQIYDIDVHFTSVIPGTLVYTGHVVKRTGGAGGLLIGVTTSIPLPATIGPPPSGNSCLSKTANAFTLTGAAVTVINL